MAVQEQRVPSFSSILIVLSITFYCVGFILVRLELNQLKKRLNDSESVTKTTELPSNDLADSKFINNAPDVRSHEEKITKRNADNAVVGQNKGCMPGTKGPALARDCFDLLKSGHSQSGVYSVDPDGQGRFDVYCDMCTDGGGWTVFQRRQDGSVDFYRGWGDYKAGFGQLTGEFWLGNDKIHRLTACRCSTLRVELEDWSSTKVYAKYGKFDIGDEQTQYRLRVGSYSGTAGDSLSWHNDMAFTTKDRDNDKVIRSGYFTNCAVRHTGAWWYNACYQSNLNGKYLGNHKNDRAVTWRHFNGKYLSMKSTEMKLRSSY
ncbi:fibrinogen-like protein A [Stylophora pistillata]|uniref:Fibrinogen C domain-containing protein 1 n=1 Tax=Stylophora pistillata TaxID=50429 RepID=A0A2B4RC55_STYPI|nr:fibrinogen-like protein A [Stylophora pistillata]PFX13812.1 Fibrinogen C domain-containing protein 1 [Stylophora pistillata]